jgi:predicted nucleic acid-binding protein
MRLGAHGPRIRGFPRDSGLPLHTILGWSSMPRLLKKCAEIIAESLRPCRDGFIAATALVHRMTLVTRDVGDFEGAGVALVNPWKAL